MKDLDTTSIEWQESDDPAVTESACRLHAAGGGAAFLAMDKYTADARVPWEYGKGAVPSGPHWVYFVPPVPQPEGPDAVKANLHAMLDMAIERDNAEDFDEAQRLLNGISQRMGYSR